MEGEVIIQTFTPHSPSIQFARHHDFEGFAEQELAIRQQFSYPPYTSVGLIHIRSNHERRAEFTASILHQRLKKRLAEEDLSSSIILGEVLPSPLVRAHGQYRFQLLLRSTHARKLSSLVQSVLYSMGNPEDTTIALDMDAQSLG